MADMNRTLNQTIPSYEKLENTMVKRHTKKVHEVLKNGKVAIAGLGGLGSNIAVMLARSGIGTLFLVDFDIVDLSNLNRQSYFIRHLGMQKTEALQEELKEIQPYITIQTETIKVTKENVASLFSEYPIVCEAFDDPDQKAMLVNSILTDLPHTTIVSGSGMAGYGSSNLIRTTHPMKRLYICGDQISETNPEHSLMAPRVQICAGHQANMILRLLLSIEEP